MTRIEIYRKSSTSHASHIRHYKIREIETSSQIEKLQPMQT